MGRTMELLRTKSNLEVLGWLRMVRRMTDLFDQLLRQAEQRYASQTGRDRGPLALYENFLRLHQRTWRGAALDVVIKAGGERRVGMQSVFALAQ